MKRWAIACALGSGSLIRYWVGKNPLMHSDTRRYLVFRNARMSAYKICLGGPQSLIWAKGV